MKRPRKDEHIQVRATRDQKRAIEEAARKAGIGTSSWLLMVGLKQADESH